MPQLSVPRIFRISSLFFIGASVAIASLEPTDELHFNGDVFEFIDFYCIDCHASDITKGEINLEGLSNVGDHYEERDIWESVYEQLKAGAMPSNTPNAQLNSAAVH